jgi:hypothetical protein
MSNVTVLLVYETPGGSPLTIARVVDTRVITEVARAAVGAVELRADALSEADMLLGQVEWAEANRLRRVLTLLVPDFHIGEVPPPSTAVM